MLNFHFAIMFIIIIEKLSFTPANFGITLLCIALLIKPILAAVCCNFDANFFKVYFSATRVGKCLVSKFTINVVWKTKKVQSFFPLKDKNLHPTSKIYYGLCSCGEDYVGETKRNVSVHYDKHNKPSKKSKPAAHLEQNTDHYFIWRILCNAPSNARTGTNIEAFFIAIMRPSLNE